MRAVLQKNTFKEGKGTLTSSPSLGEDAQSYKKK